LFFENFNLEENILSDILNLNNYWLWLSRLHWGN